MIRFDPEGLYTPSADLFFIEILVIKSDQCDASDPIWREKNGRILMSLDTGGSREENVFFSVTLIL